MPFCNPTSEIGIKESKTFETYTYASHVVFSFRKPSKIDKSFFKFSKACKWNLMCSKISKEHLCVLKLAKFSIDCKENLAIDFRSFLDLF